MVRKMMRLARGAKCSGLIAPAPRTRAGDSSEASAAAPMPHADCPRNVRRVAGGGGTWTDVDGRTMQAQFIREVDGDVTFLKDGKLLIVPLDRFREEDQKLIRELEARKKVEEPVLPAGAPRPQLAEPGNDAQ